jgi:hypothetical protein
MDFCRRIGFAIFVLLVAAGGAAAAPGLTLDGQVQKTAQLTAGDLEALPATSVAATFMTSQGGKPAPILARCCGRFSRMRRSATIPKPVFAIRSSLPARTDTRSRSPSARSIPISKASR